MLRILSHQCADGPRHMATDEALLSAGAGSSLRTYEWTEPCISLGYFQDYHSVHHRLPQPVSMVRRITGGGAIYHVAEVTYCLIAERGSELPRRSQDIFTLLHGHILQALHAHAVTASLNQQQQGDKRFHHDVRCFASPAAQDIMGSSGKMLGSAARNFKNRVLIHGSLKLHSNDWDLETVTGCGLTPQQARQILIDGIVTALGLPIEYQEYSSAEQQLINACQTARYADRQWLEQRIGPRACFI